MNSAKVTEDSVVGTGGRYRICVVDPGQLQSVTQLTLNLGLRHDILLPYVEVLDRQSYFSPSTPNPAAGGYPGALAFYGKGPNACNCSNTVDTHYLLLGPRIGFAYSVDSKTVYGAATA